MRRFQALTAAKSQGDVDDPRTNLSVRSSIGSGHAGNGPDSPYRTRYFVIGISVLCLSAFLVIHFLLSTRIKKVSSFSLHGSLSESYDAGDLASIIMSANRNTLPRCWSKNGNGTSLEWKATLVERLRNTKSHDSVDIHSGKYLQRDKRKGLDISGIRRHPRYFYDVSHLYDAAHVPGPHHMEASATSQEMKKVPGENVINAQKDSSSSPSLQNGIFLPSVDSEEHSIIRYRNSVEPDAGVCVRESNSLGLRCLPSFLIIGAMKSGTGDLMDWLNLHPNLQSGDYRSNDRHLILSRSQLNV